ncbi:DUF4188 domain-containing protein [Streptomyces sp. NPDC028722]|uniref:monooxygenase family protein n=1 Tax=Streptomyces sp. NPDC028722 TaxID=3155016 RepID=UPI0033D21199
MVLPPRWIPRLPEELARDGGSGLLGHRGLGGGPRVFTVAQYGESREKLLAYAYAYAYDRVGQHHPAWAAFDRRVRGSKGGVGIRHETYIVPAGSCESLHIETPPAAGRGTGGRTHGPARGNGRRSDWRAAPLSPPGPDPADGGAGTGVQSRYGFDRRRSTQPVATTPAPTRAAPTPSVSGP